MKIRAGQAILAITVVLALALGALGSLGGITLMECRVDENRTLAPLPDASPLALRTFITQWDAYMADHFAYRDVLIRGYTLFRFHVINAYSAENRIVDWFENEQ